VVVDRFTKLVKYILYSTTIDSTELANIIIEYIVLKYRVPDLIVSDRGSMFTSGY